ncbi:MAG: UbiD family decarboxylase [Bacteroidia bacterium]|nr:UbiD family decarboxylase [Bacteroidia bacterium]
MIFQNSYSSLKEALLDLEQHSELVRLKTEVDSYLEMAAIHLRVNEMQGPALWFENVKNSRFSAASNIFGTYERAKFLFRDTFHKTEWLIKAFKNPSEVFQNPLKSVKYIPFALKALPKRVSNIPHLTCHITDLPLIHHWPKDGGAFVTLPQVYSENVEQPGIWNSNLGMYRIQLTGNEYILNKEIGLHYQLHRGIGIHQQIAKNKKVPFKVSIFVGGPPAHTLAAVMPLPESMTELMFAGLLANRRFRYAYKNNYCISTDADFVITGEVIDGLLKPEGPFGDHLGYYSLQHPFPVLKVESVYYRKDAVWPFTVVGRPPQEDSIFGKIIHELTGWAAQKEVYGLKDLYAVDEAGVHPLLLATGSERYTPYLDNPEPSEIITIAHHIMGTGQLSLLKYLFITAEYDEKVPRCYQVKEFIQYVLERIDLNRDVHFYTNTPIDTLDYSGAGLNRGSKLVLAAYGSKKRNLCREANEKISSLQTFFNPKVVFPGVLVLQGNVFKNYETTQNEIKKLEQEIKEKNIDLNGFPLIVITDDSEWVSQHINNWLWVTFTRSNPVTDVYGLNEKIIHHSFVMDNLIIDARIKPHHAPVLEKDPAVEKKIDKLFSKGGELYEWFTQKRK